jgi:hypothetical protein
MHSRAAIAVLLSLAALGGAADVDTVRDVNATATTIAATTTQPATSTVQPTTDELVTESSSTTAVSTPEDDGNATGVDAAAPPNDRFRPECKSSCIPRIDRADSVIEAYKRHRAQVRTACAHPPLSCRPHCLMLAISSQ